MQVPPPGTVGGESDSNAPNAMYNNNSTDASIALAAHTLADQLRPFVPQNTLDATHIADLQLAICRKLREVSHHVHCAHTRHTYALRSGSSECAE